MYNNGRSKFKSNHTMSVETNNGSNLKERIARLQDLRRKFGSAIPPNLLNEVGFEQRRDDDGVTSFIPFEKLASRALRSVSPENRSVSEHWRLPRTVLTIDAPAVEVVGSRIPAYTLAKRMKKFALDIKGIDIDYGGVPGSAIDGDSLMPFVYGQNSAVEELAGRYPDILYMGDDRETVPEDDNGVIDHLGFTVDAIIDDLGGNDRHFFGSVQGQVESIARGGEWVDSDLSNEILTVLQGLRSRVGDIEEAEKFFEHELEQHIDNKGGFAKRAEEDISFHTGYFASILRDNHFMQAAAEMEAATTLKEAQAAICRALGSNEVLEQAKLARSRRGKLAANRQKTKRRYVSYQRSAQP